MSNIVWRYWRDVAKLLVDRLDGTYAERIEAYPPIKLLTDNDGGNSDERGLPAGTYYIRLAALGNGATTGVYSLYWEERP